MVTKEIASLFELKGSTMVWEQWLKDCADWIKQGETDRALRHLIVIQESMKETLNKIETIKNEEQNG